MSFGYDGAAVYFHTARDGWKIAFLTENPPGCVEFEHGAQLVPDATTPLPVDVLVPTRDRICSVQELTAEVEKALGLNQITRHYCRREGALATEDLNAIRGWKIPMENLTGVQSKDESGL